ncbi:vacuolar protein sorting-associated protein IST1-like [Bidens hawaiensis]|uniref:vacuolar protein sorting-associated protein IST1-like n=1 Tax=Bidens hawaiensis TaxID=980011 RepID=UPI00404A23ED
MGRKLDALLGRKFKATKFKATVNLAVTRLTILKNKRQARLALVRADTIQLLKLDHHEQSLIRVDHVIKDQNMLDVYVMVDGYCHLLMQMANLIEKQRDCPDELREAVSSLLFAAPRCGELPELQEIHAILTARYGKEFANGAIELRNNCGVNLRMIQKLSSKQSGLEARMKMLQEIATENDIVLKFEDSAPVIKEVEGESSNGGIEKSSSDLGDDLDEVLSFTESVKGKKKYKDVEDAALAAFESAASAVVAAKAAVELSRSRSFGSDSSGSCSSNSRVRKVLDSNPNGSKLGMKYEENREIESEYEDEHKHEHEHEHKGYTPSENTIGFDGSDNEIEKEPIDLTMRPISVRNIVVYGQ